MSKPACPKCGENSDVSVMLFMGVQPDGYVCGRCSLYFDETDEGTKALAIVIGMETRNNEPRNGE